MVKIKQAIRTGGELVAVAEREAVDRIRDEIAIGVVGRHRPKCIDRRDFAFVEMENVTAAATVKRTPFAINGKRRIDGILR